VAGLLTARVLWDHHEEVTIIERDPLPSEGGHRPGVPHSRHTHGLLAGGREVLEHLFPGITDDLVKHGAVTGDIVRDFRWYVEGGYLSRSPSDCTALLTTRPMLEAAIRARVRAAPNVRILDLTSVERLRYCQSARAVTGVFVNGEAGCADLVVDAAGRGSRTPPWLEHMGYERPREEVIKLGLAYTTRHFHRHPHHLSGDIGAVIPRVPPHGKRGGVMLAQEGGRWTVTLTSHSGDYAPENLGGFIEFARSLPANDIYKVVRDAQPAGEPASFRFPASVRKRYEELTSFPAGYLVIGDALCSFNPVYGQGMSVALLEARELETLLASGAENLAPRFFARASKVIDTQWAIAVGSDLRIPEAEGPRPPGLQFKNWYISQLHRAAHTDPACALAFHRVGNLLALPSSILRPRIALRVLRAQFPNFAPSAESPPVTENRN
jgi:2-polyprenyl-6-methoxyphenol hydroxylase-like FAD-dependent oxidoreductase